MTFPHYSYLDLTVMPFLRKRVVSGDAVILFNGEFSRVMWANAMGAELFGGDDIFELLDIELTENHPLVRQLVNAGRQLDETGPVMRGFRVSRGLKSDLLQGELQRVILPNDEEARLLVFEAGHKASRLREHELAGMAVDALEGFADAAAIVDEYGLIVASTKGFDRLGIDPDTLETLIGIVAREDDRLVKRKVRTGSGKEIAAGLGRIRDVPSRFLIVMANPENEEQAAGNEDSSAMAVTRNATTEDNPSTDSVFVAGVPGAPNAGGFGLDQTGEEPAVGRSESQVAEGEYRSHQDDGGAEAAHSATTEITKHKEVAALKAEAPDRSLLDRWYFSDDSRRDRDELKVAEAASEGDEADEEPVASDAEGQTEEQPDQHDVDENRSTDDEKASDAPGAQASAPVRFAFAIDENQVIRSVSPELEDAVGNKSGDVTGRTWADIAAERNFDNDGIIHGLLQKADTWSGKSVLWPVDDTDMVVPVDLAALPVFDKDRKFNGFRGFGVIRVNDAIVDPDATGASLTAGEQDEDDEIEEGIGPVWSSDFASEEEHRQGTADPETDQGEERRLPRNVFQLPRRDIGTQPSDSDAESSTDDELTGREKRAFSEISKSLADQIEDNHRASEEAYRDIQASNDDHDSDADASITVGNDLLGSLPVPLIVYTPQALRFANGALLELAGYESLDELEHGGGLDALLGGVNAQQSEDNNRTVRLHHHDGEVIPVRSRLTRVNWRGESALCLTFEPADAEMEEERSALDMVRVAELENILETAADGILVFDQDGKIISLNAPGEALFGRDQKDVVGMSFGKLFATESRQALEAYVRELNAPGVSGVLAKGREAIGIEAGGGMIPIFATIGKVGGSGRYCAVLRDLTEWKKAEEELVKAKRSAETASEQKTEFLSRISHEIREPLTAIIGFSDVMIEGRFGPIENERYREYLKDINRSGVHVLDLVNDLLDISKIEAGKLELSYEAVDLNQLAAETVALLQPQANNKRILIRTSLSRAVPKVVADARSIRQIILNLVSNAINHSPVNSQVIVSTTYEENSEVGLRIRDTGKGMTQEELERAIEPFSQIGEDRLKGGGTGLGLPLTKALVEANRAYFDLESTPGEGTIAHIQFPSQRVLAD